MPPTASQATTGRRRMFRVFGLTFFMPYGSLADTCCILATQAADSCFYFLGIILIIFATAIIVGLVYSFFFVLYPMIQRAHAKDQPYLWPYTHVLFVAFLVINVVFNYVSCITTKHDGPVHQKIIRELADATGFVYPETAEDVNQYKRDFSDRMLLRLKRRKELAEKKIQQSQENSSSEGMKQKVSDVADNTAVTKRKVGEVSNNQKHSPATVRSWMVMGPHEWGFCDKSHQPKPPRAHYDHVTKKLVLNMDHFCPWMFNCVGFLNYRYFYNFLLFVFISMVYGIALTLKPFMSIYTKFYFKQIKMSRQEGFATVQHMFDYVPTPEERTAVTFTILLCASVGLGVTTLLIFHTYLMLTAQTTIEFQGNLFSKRRARLQKQKFKNPYDLGWKRNFQQIYGLGNPVLKIFIPSSREPEFLPLPLPGKEGLRCKSQGEVREPVDSGPNIV
mmetsp:Transcript_17318/g.26234  ORF Transcript_17318/g.26234 Transcript_17318/m.26234 type:complete len:447 (+) Transcript_17318:42-1382(+)